MSRNGHAAKRPGGIQAGSRLAKGEFIAGRVGRELQLLIVTSSFGLELGKPTSTIYRAPIDRFAHY